MEQRAAKVNNRILIITGGQIDAEFLNKLVQQKPYTMIIAADRGLQAADHLKLPLDYIVGDFDSVPKQILEKYREKSTPIKTFPSEKDKTDTHIAIEMALMHTPTDIDIVGATGNRLDYVLANLDLLILPLHLNINACILDPNNKIYLKKHSFTIKKKEQYGDFVSLLPLSYQVRGLTLRGFKYPLGGITLTAGSSLGISNEIVDEDAVVEFQEGILTVVEAKD